MNVIKTYIDKCRLIADKVEAQQDRCLFRLRMLHHPVHQHQQQQMVTATSA